MAGLDPGPTPRSERRLGEGPAWSDGMQPRPEDAMEEVEAEVEAEAAPKAAAGPELGFWLAARRWLTPEPSNPFPMLHWLCGRIA